MHPAFSVLSEPLFRWYAAAVLASSSHVWAYWVTQTWLIVRLSDGNPVIVGITAGCQFLPIVVVGLVGGSLADRFAKYKVWAYFDLVFGAFALFTAVLVYLEVVRPWHVMVIALGAGSASALSQPSRQTLAAEVVSLDRLVAAMAITSSMVGTGRVVGPLLTAVLLTRFGIDVLFAYLALAIAISSLVLIRVFRRGCVDDRPSMPSPRVPSVFAYLVQRVDLSVILGMLVVVCAFGWNSQMMIALVAEGVFNADAQQFAALTALYGLGGVLGTLTMIGRTLPTIRGLIAQAVSLAGLGMLAGWAPSFTTFAMALVPLGFSAFQIAVAASVVFIVQSPTALRGRVMGIFMIATNGSVALGGPALGLLSKRAGPQGAYVWSGVIIGASLLIVIVLSVVKLRHYPWLSLAPESNN